MEDWAEIRRLHRAEGTPVRARSTSTTSMRNYLILRAKVKAFRADPAVIRARKPRTGRDRSPLVQAAGPVRDDLLVPRTPISLDPCRDHLRKRRTEDPAVLVQQLLREIRGQQETLAGIEAACPEMTALASLVRSFAALLAPDPGNDARLRQWITAARAASLPDVHSFTRGLDLDIQAATAALTLPHHNGPPRGSQYQDQDDQAAGVRTRRTPGIN